MQAGNDDDKSLQPHTHVHDQRNDKEDGHVGADLFEPKELWRDDVAEDQAPIGEGVRAGHPVPDHVTLIFIGAVPAKKRFRHVAVGDDQARPQHDLRHVV